MRQVKAAIGLAAAFVLAMPAATASAGASSYEDRQIAHFYINADYAVYTGPPFEQGCLGEGFIESRTHVVRPTESREISRSKFEDRIQVYDNSEYGFTDPFDLISLACDAVFSGEGEVPVPIASGEGTVTSSQKVSVLPDGFVVQAQDSVRGDVVDEFGQVWSVHGLAKYTVTVQGDTDDFELQIGKLDVKKSGN